MASLQELLGTTVIHSHVFKGVVEKDVMEKGVVEKEVVESQISPEAKQASALANTHNEADLERALWFLYQQWNQVGFKPRAFYRMFTRHTKQYRGGIAAVQTTLREDGGTGFEFLKHRGKRQLSIESLVLRESWAHLFNDGDRQIAQQRLDGIAR
jgi:hypothetical protein